MIIPFSDGHDDSRVRLKLPLPPSVNAMFINVPGRGRAKSHEYKSWIKDAGWILVSQRPAKIAGRYDLSVLVPDNMPGDIDNRLKAISDLLVAHQVTPDDRHARYASICRTPRLDSGAIVFVHEVR